MKKTIIGIFVLTLVIFNLKFTFSNLGSYSLEEISFKKSYASESSSGGKCLQVERINTQREVQLNGNLPDGIYIVQTTAKDCWTGTATQCERGTQIVSYNIVGQVVETNGSFSSVNCTI